MSCGKPRLPTDRQVLEPPPPAFARTTWRELSSWVRTVAYLTQMSYSLPRPRRSARMRLPRRPPGNDGYAATAGFPLQPSPLTIQFFPQGLVVLLIVRPLALLLWSRSRRDVLRLIAFLPPPTALGAATHPSAMTPIATALAPLGVDFGWLSWFQSWTAPTSRVPL
jgi:hypothetical protein